MTTTSDVNAENVAPTVQWIYRCVAHLVLGLDAPSKVEATLKVELIVRALEDTLIELGIDDSQFQPVLGRRLRELDAAP